MRGLSASECVYMVYLRVRVRICAPSLRVSVRICAAYLSVKVCICTPFPRMHVCTLGTGVQGSDGHIGQALGMLPRFQLKFHKKITTFYTSIGGRRGRGG
jgi:hypothetical protein